MRASRRYGHYLRLSTAGRIIIDTARVKAAARLDGKFIIHSNDDTLSGRGHTSRSSASKEAWRTLKSGLRPVYHGAVHRIHAHVALRVLALLLERTVELACADTGRTICTDLK